MRSVVWFYVPFYTLCGIIPITFENLFWILLNVHKNYKSFINISTKLCKMFKNALTNPHFVVKYKLADIILLLNLLIPILSTALFRKGAFSCQKLLR